MELRRYGPILRRWAWLIALGLVISLVVSAAIAQSTTPTFESRTRIIVGPTLNSQDSSFDVLRSATQLVLTYRELVTTPPILDATIETLSLDESRATLTGRVSVSSNDVTRVLSIRVRHADPEQAARIANTLADVLIVQNGSQQAGDEAQLTVIDAAEPGTSPVSPNKPLMIILGVLGAMLLVVAVIAIAELVQGHVRTVEDVRDITHAPSLGTLRMSTLDPHLDPYFAGENDDHPVPEAYALASRKLLSGVRVGNDGYSILVCSPNDTPLSAEFSAYLAAAIARSGVATLLIDADLARRGLSRFFGLNGGAGFANLVSGWDVPDSRHAATVDSIRQLRIALHTPRAIRDLLVVPSGSIDAIAGASPDRLRATLDALGKVPAVTIVSGPPMASDADALVLAQSADAVVLVAVGNETRAADLAKAVENLGLVEATNLWTIIANLSPRDRLDRWIRRKRAAGPELVASNMTLEADRRVPAREPAVA